MQHCKRNSDTSVRCTACVVAVVDKRYNFNCTRIIDVVTLRPRRMPFFLILKCFLMQISLHIQIVVFFFIFSSSVCIYLIERVTNLISWTYDCNYNEMQLFRSLFSASFFVRAIEFSLVWRGEQILLTTFCSLHTAEIWLWLLFVMQNDMWMHGYDYRSYWRKFIHFVNLLSMCECVRFIILFTVMLHWLSHKLRRTCLAKLYIMFRSVQSHIVISSKMKRH